MPDDIDLNSLRNRWLNSSVLQDIVRYFHELGEKNPSQKIVEVGKLQAFLEQRDSAHERTFVIDALRNLQGTGVGRFIVGRRGKKSRFETSLPLREIAQKITAVVAQDAADDGLTVRSDLANIQALPNPSFPGQTRKPDSDIQEQGDSKRFIKIQFKVAHDFFVSARIPETLSRSDALKLADFIKALPFDSELETTPAFGLGFRGKGTSVSSKVSGQKRVCDECGQGYSVDETRITQPGYWEHPYNYSEGSAKYCLACWLGVGSKDVAKGAEEYAEHPPDRDA